jgi:hypothetical protein
VRLPDSAADGFRSSLGAHYGGSCEEATKGVDAMRQDLFSPLLPVELRDLYAYCLLNNLADDPSISRTTRAALLHAAGRLWEAVLYGMLCDDDDPDGPEGDDGPLSLEAPDEGGEPSLSSPGLSSIPSPSSSILPDRMFR